MCLRDVVTNYNIHLCAINVLNETIFVDIRRLAYFDMKRADSHVDFLTVHTSIHLNVFCFKRASI